MNIEFNFSEINIDNIILFDKEKLKYKIFIKFENNNIKNKIENKKFNDLFIKLLLFLISKKILLKIFFWKLFIFNHLLFFNKKKILIIKIQFKLKL